MAIFIPSYDKCKTKFHTMHKTWQSLTVLELGKKTKFHKKLLFKMATQFDFGTRVSVNLFSHFACDILQLPSVWKPEKIFSDEDRRSQTYETHIRSIERLTSTFPYIFYSPKVSENQKFEEKNNDERFMLSKNTLSSQPKKKHCTVRSQRGPNL